MNTLKSQIVDRIVTTANTGLSSGTVTCQKRARRRRRPARPPRGSPAARQQPGQHGDRHEREAVVHDVEGGDRVERQPLGEPVRDAGSSGRGAEGPHRQRRRGRRRGTPTRRCPVTAGIAQATMIALVSTPRAHGPSRTSSSATEGAHRHGERHVHRGEHHGVGQGDLPQQTGRRAPRGSSRGRPRRARRSRARAGRSPRRPAPRPGRAGRAAARRAPAVPGPGAARAASRA